MYFTPDSPMGRLMTKPKKVQERAHRMWRWKNRLLIARIEKELMEWHDGCTS
jgi:hypothetical protein